MGDSAELVSSAIPSSVEYKLIRCRNVLETKVLQIG